MTLQVVAAHVVCEIVALCLFAVVVFLATKPPKPRVFVPQWQIEQVANMRREERQARRFFFFFMLPALAAALALCWVLLS